MQYDGSLEDALDRTLSMFKRPKLKDNGFGKGETIKLEHVRIAYDWLTTDTVYTYVKRQSSPSLIVAQYAHSYSDKHYLQRVGLHIFGKNWFVTNGAFIAAAIIAELDVQLPYKGRDPRGANISVKRKKVGSMTVDGITKSWKLHPYRPDVVELGGEKRS